MKVAVAYTARKLPGSSAFGIDVREYVNGVLETRDLNLAPYPTREVALQAAERAAQAARERLADRLGVFPIMYRYGRA